MTGFLGQKFDFTGIDGSWYALVSDLPALHLNMRVTAPVPSLPEITYITGLSLLVSDVDGLDHAVVIAVKEPHNLNSSCPTGVSSCLADGALAVTLDGEERLLVPGAVTLGPGVSVSAVNLPGACRSFGFEKYYERKKLERAQGGRRLQAHQLSMDEWILGDPTATDMEECKTYVAEAMVTDGGLFDHQSEHGSFQIMTPKATIRVSHGRLHQLAMRDPTDRFDLPDHLTWQMNLAINHNDVSHDATGVLGETMVPTRDGDGNRIMTGMASIRGSQEDCECRHCTHTYTVHRVTPMFSLHATNVHMLQCFLPMCSRLADRHDHVELISCFWVRRPEILYSMGPRTRYSQVRTYCSRFGRCYENRLEKSCSATTAIPNLI